MDWERYKRICDTPNVLPRWMLEQTSELTDDRLTRLLEQALQSSPVPRPDDHRGGASTDMFELSLPVPLVEEIARVIDAAVAARRTTSGTADRGLGGFSEAWNEYAQYLNERVQHGKAI